VVDTSVSVSVRFKVQGVYALANARQSALFTVLTMTKNTSTALVDHRSKHEKHQHSLMLNVDDDD